ncbi:tetrapyrrole methylase family protein/MazG family protein [Laceyella sediminis]|uniref:Tetrapyrrole methylase family protein/MazG family protein n=1 Tax=Laceyella sediminis TaxID=573074 RepID=A0ABX5EM31_9BACL|nr:nucleoside triphosphate pyrophosphohydrolase [Laceyella sediminis]PRZ13232.1 tetrapyrrole methylase family protein/MazG family protein [Laceyella sediminis]
MNGKIVVVGLGFGDENGLTLGTLAVLERADRVFLRTERHPVVSWLRERGIQYVSFDDVYEKHARFETVYEEIAERLLAYAEEGGTVVYAVPGHPMVAERTVQLLLDAEGIAVEVHGGTSFLDAMFASLKLDPIEGFQLLDGNDLSASRLDPRTHVLIGQVYDRLVASDVKLTLMDVYPDEHPVTIATACGVPGLEKLTTLPLYELDHGEWFTDLTSVYVPPVTDERALYRQFSTLVDVIATLRSPEGCPWDRKQTHESLRRYLIEEAYEFLEAVHDGDEEAMADELGDILLQVMLHAQIASEEGTFDIFEVISRLNDKMVRRHPHVFGEAQADTAEEVKANWEQIKAKEREGEAEPPSVLGQVNEALPALLLAYQQQKKAAKVGFDWEQMDEVFDKVREELDELGRAETATEREEELGDLLFALVNLSRFLKVDPELALIKSCQKFARRFRYIEERVRSQNRAWPDVSLAEMDAWWNEAKREEKGNPRKE